MKAIVICSGGADSTVALHKVWSEADDLHVLAFNYGQRHVKELECVKEQCSTLALSEKLHIVDLRSVIPGQSTALVNGRIAVPHVQQVLGDPQPFTYVPNRNMIFLSVAAGWAEDLGFDTVAYGAQRHDIYGYWDTTIMFVEAVQSVLELNRKNPIQLYAPLIGYSKTDVIREGLRLGIDFSLTWSCYNGQEEACGICPTCTERLNAFRELGRVDPIPYQVAQ
jgi:7-cyano-7-deazaguanine synthase